jgi:uncharacterized protein YjbJ (UPF0337 family)
MKNRLARLAGQWKRLRDQAKKVWDDLAGSKAPTPAYIRETTMNNKWNHVAGHWARFYGQAREQWSELTENELIEVDGRFELLTKKLQEKYGLERAEARQQIDMWTANLTV